ncbi:MAG: DM13 domain-containing protein [Sediminibacterium sp.]
MRKFSIYCCLAFTIAACKKESTSTTPINERVDSVSAQMPVSMAMLTSKLNGKFSDGSGPSGTVSGTAMIYLVADKYQLSLENFMTANGPDLKVYLSKEIQPVNFVNLGSLKATSGNQLYSVPVEVKISDYKYALIYCQQYGHLFGAAELKP